MAPQIPDRWLDYKPIGKRIEGTRFVAFKVPLREHVMQHVEDESNRLDGKILLEKLPSLGLIIDLTNTQRYYDPNFFDREGVEHKKLMIPGHVTPPNYLVKKFKLYVLSFLNNNKDNDKLIGVHCTHGVNRTGYLICNYMISEMIMEPKEAIKRFDAARGHKIERENYLEALQNLTEEDNCESTQNDEETVTDTTTNDQSYGSWRKRRAHEAAGAFQNKVQTYTTTATGYSSYPERREHSNQNRYNPYGRGHRGNHYDNQRFERNTYTHNNSSYHSQNNSTYDRHQSYNHRSNFRNGDTNSTNQPQPKYHYVRPENEANSYGKSSRGKNLNRPEHNNSRYHNRRDYDA